MAGEVSFRQLFCRALGCGLMFFICRPCYRGQAYCGEECRQKSRREQRRKANRRYWQDPEIRQDHRERMREHRQRRRESRVIDQSSIVECGSGTISGPAAVAAEEKRHELPKQSWRERLGQVVCIICGRCGRFVAARMRRE
jgi:hypothetical protein